MAPKPEARLDTVVNLGKRRGFVFPSGEIYGGTGRRGTTARSGVELKENIKRQWWRSMVTSRDDVVGLDSAVILPREVWVASGHVEVFTDPLVECLNCHKRLPRRTTCRRRTRRRRADDPADGAGRRSRARTAAPRASGPSRATST